MKNKNIIKDHLNSCVSESFYSLFSLNIQMLRQKISNTGSWPQKDRTKSESKRSYSTFFFQSSAIANEFKWPQAESTHYHHLFLSVVLYEDLDLENFRLHRRGKKKTHEQVVREI